MPERRSPRKGTGQKKLKKRPVQPVAELLPGLLANAINRHDDFIVTCETDPDTEKKTLHILSGRFVTSCMLRKLIGQAESQQDEGGIIISRTWA